MTKGYRIVQRCKECKKIYPKGAPEICVKCGVRLGYTSLYLKFFTGRVILNYTDKCEKVAAKKTILGWKVREESNDDDTLRVQTGHKDRGNDSVGAGNEG